MKVNHTHKKIPFFKMTALSNDFIFIDKKYAFDTRFAIKNMCDRKLGIGCDQMIIYIEDIEHKVVYLDIINNDGSFAESCGNAFRCAGDYFCYKNSWNSMTILANNKKYPLEYKNGFSYVNMGSPIIKEISFNDIKIGNFKNPFYVNVGNPHVILFSDTKIQKEDVIKYGEIIENHKMFPKKINVNFVRVITKEKIEIQTWERAIGYSLSCGTGATASFIASYYMKLVNEATTIQTCGGVINAYIDNHNIVIHGNTLFVFEGLFNLYETN